LHDTAYTNGLRYHEEISCDIAQIFESENYGEKKIETICSLINGYQKITMSQKKPMEGLLGMRLLPFGRELYGKSEYYGKELESDGNLYQKRMREANLTNVPNRTACFH